VPRKRRTVKPRRAATDLSPAVRHYLLTGKDPIGLDGKWQWFQLLYGPFGLSREESREWNPPDAFEPYRAALRAEGLAPVQHIPELDDSETLTTFETD
jgi:hypothetical protein